MSEEIKAKDKPKAEFVARFGTAAALLSAGVAVVSAGVAIWQVNVNKGLARQAGTWQISSNILSQFDSDDMGKARLTLERYFFILSGEQSSPAYLAKRTQQYWEYFIYQKAVTLGEDLRDPIKSYNDKEKQEFFQQVDLSRRRVKNFHENIMLFSESNLITEFREKVLTPRFYRNAADFLECYWLPVELGQNAALYRGRMRDNDERACNVINWYRKHEGPTSGRSSCHTYADRQPEHCLNPQVEPVQLE